MGRINLKEMSIFRMIRRNPDGKDNGSHRNNRNVDKEMKKLRSNKGRNIFFLTKKGITYIRVYSLL